MIKNLITLNIIVNIYWVIGMCVPSVRHQKFFSGGAKPLPFPSHLPLSSPPLEVGPHPARESSGVSEEIDFGAF